MDSRRALAAIPEASEALRATSATAPFIWRMASAVSVVRASWVSTAPAMELVRSLRCEDVESSASTTPASCSAVCSTPSRRAFSASLRACSASARAASPCRNAASAWAVLLWAVPMSSRN